jgi:hypothetical protein
MRKIDMASLGEVLAEFKKSEAPENIFPLLDDVALCNALIAWKSVRVVNKKSQDCGETDDLSKWEWMWQQVEVNVSEFGVVAGCRGQDAAALLTRLRGLRLIYPDGSINNFAKQYLGQLIVQRLKKKSASA